MQGLSSRAHAFSVEALVGKSCKRMKVENEKEASSMGDTATDAGTIIQDSEDYVEDHPLNPRKKARSTPMTPGSDTEEEPRRVGVDETGLAEETRGPGESMCHPGRDVRVELQGSELWNRFHEIGTEMIITKAGRRMFPSVRVKVRNLDPCQQYYIAMDIMPVDSKRYRYVYHSSQWMVAGNTDHSCIAPRLYVHPDSPCAGETWMRQIISFDRVKLTNNEMDDKGHIILQSMHKYKPRVHVILHDQRMDLFQIPSLPAEGVYTFSFQETEFTTVTAYQNQQITKLKIDRNPFAKGFRDPGRNRGVLDGLLESYPWRSPLSLDFKHFTLLQGNSGMSANGVLPLKSLIPFSCPPPAHPFSLSCQEGSLHSLSLPLYCKSSSPLATRAFSSPEGFRLRGLPPLAPLSDFSFFSALQGKKASYCRGSCFQGPLGAPSCLLPLQSPLSPRAPHPHHPHHPDSAAGASHCLYRYGLPMNPHLAALSRHAKLAEGTTDCLRGHLQTAWHPTTNHCL
ncbi:T-box transcription factor TBX22 [Hypomesus transpacificus]|uniref:T-box transcription factor TBX22 n=1 Tax=Hypomesus transpacificus TaxID=137520 RepID=UPI001F0761B0|nr:T-box transcription factor TBX22 [Hypomesus transpacificus]